MIRPLRFLFKLAVRLRHGRAMSHAFMWLPHLSLTKPAAGRRGEIFYKGRKIGELLPADALAKAAGDEIYIIGSGPSVRTNDLSRIPDHAAILLNGAISLVGEGLGTPLALAIEDERFVYRHFGMLKAKVGDDVVCLFSVPVLRAIAEMEPAWLAGRAIVLIDNVRKPYDAPRPGAAELAANSAAVAGNEASTGFSLDPDWGVFQGGSVVVSAMQFAVYCRPSAIGLLGIDISNANEPRFYEKKGQMAKSGVARATERIVAHLTLAKRVAASRNIAIRNHSPVSVLRSAGFGYDDRLARMIQASGLTRRDE